MTASNLFASKSIFSMSPVTKFRCFSSLLDARSLACRTSATRVGAHGSVTGLDLSKAEVLHANE